MRGVSKEVEKRGISRAQSDGIAEEDSFVSPSSFRVPRFLHTHHACVPFLSQRSLYSACQTGYLPSRTRIKINNAELIISFRVRSFGMIQIRINDPRSLGSWCIKGTDESTLGKDSSVPLMHHDPSDLGSLILIWFIPKELTLSVKATFQNAELSFETLPPDRIAIWNFGFCGEGSARSKTTRSKDEKQRQPEPTYDEESENQTRVTLAWGRGGGGGGGGGECCRQHTQLHHSDLPLLVSFL